MKSILTVECIKLTENDTEGAGYDAIEVDGWIYQFRPLPGSLFEYEMDGAGIEDTVNMIFGDSDGLHAEMQKIIGDGKIHFERCRGHFVIHYITDENSWMDGDNWTGPGEWNVEISLIGLLDSSKL